MIGILTLLIGWLIILGMFYNFIWPPPPSINRQLGKSDEPVQYNFKHQVMANMPRMTGGQLNFSKWLGRTGLGSLIRHVTFRKIELDLLRRIRIPDAPTLFPIVNSTSSVEELKPVDFNKFIETSAVHSEAFKFVTISDLLTKYRSCTVSPMQIAERVIEIMKDMDKQTPRLRAIVQHSEEEIRKMAAASTQRYAEGKPLSFMDGIPVAVKEEYNVIPYYTRCGTTFMNDSPATEDAHIVKKLRDGGAVIIGIANMHEVGIGTTGNNPNRLHGVPRNPYNVNHYTGGSSSGSAVAVAAGLCPVALGSDGGGSIRIPAAACGIVGIKASFGRVSTSGLVPLAQTVSYAGPLCATVKDAALVYAFISGEYQDDQFTHNQPPVTLEGFDDTSLDSFTLGVDWKYFKDSDREVHQLCEKAINFLEDCGASVVSIHIPELQETVIAHGLTILSEMAAGLEEEYNNHYNELNPETALSLGIGRHFTARDYVQAMKQRTRSMRFFRKIFKEEGVDCIITPALAKKVPEILEDAVAYGEADLSKTTAFMRYMGLGNFIGLPSMTLPVGYDNKGLPIGLQVMSSWWNEHVMLRVAHAAEKFVARKKPQIYYSLLD